MLYVCLGLPSRLRGSPPPPPRHPAPQRFAAKPVAPPRALASAGVASFGGAVVAHGLWRRGRRPRLRLLRAVVEHDAHARVVWRWLHDVVIGRQICPWSGPVASRQGIRVATTTAVTPEEVLVDLEAEAARLPRDYSARRPGEAVTTLLICPYVAEWSDFVSFWQFWRGERSRPFEEGYGVKIVAFHPGYQLSEQSIRRGDEVQLPGPDGDLLCGVVSWTDLLDDDGVDCFAVRLGDGEEVLLPYSAVVGYKDGGGDGGGGDGDTASRSDLDVGSLANRAPRPLLHLLHVDDIDRVDPESRGPALRRNRELMQRLGVAGVSRLLRACEGAAG